MRLHFAVWTDPTTGREEWYCDTSRDAVKWHAGAVSKEQKIPRDAFKLSAVDVDLRARPLVQFINQLNHGVTLAIGTQNLLKKGGGDGAPG